MPNYTQLQAFEAGQIIGRATMGVLRDNDNYFYGLANRWMPWMHAPIVKGTAGQVTTHFWQGYHLLRDDATLLHYWFWIMAGSTHSVTGVLRYYDDNGDAVVIKTLTAAAGATNSYGTSVDLSDYATISAGLHEVRFTLTHDSSDVGYAVARPPYTSYTGDEAFDSGAFPHDGITSNLSHFNTWRANDEYFQACAPNNPAFHMVQARHTINSSSYMVWDGYMRHSVGHEQVNFKVKFADDSNNNRLVIYYDFNGDVDQYSYSVTTAGSYIESSFELPANTYTHNNWYRVTVRELRDAATPGTYCWVDYLYMSPPDDLDVSDYLMDDFTPGQWVYGDTDLQSTRLMNLTNMDYLIFATMCRNATIGRMDYAVRNDSPTDYYQPRWTHRLIHVYDFLWYRGTDVVMEWGTDSTRSLPSTDTDNPVLVMDLRSISELAYGQHYTLSGDIDYACEAVYSG